MDSILKFGNLCEFHIGILNLCAFHIGIDSILELRNLWIPYWNDGS